MHNVTDNIRKTSVKPKKFQRIGRSVIGASVDFNFNSLNTSNLKEKIENNINTSAINLISKTKRNFLTNINNSSSKTPILIRDKLGNLPGHGLWCQDLSKVPVYNRNEITEIINSDIYKKKDLSESMLKVADKKTIEILKQKVSDLVSKLATAYCKFHETEYKMQREEDLKEDYFELLQKKIAENKAIFESFEPLNNQISSLTEALSNSKNEIQRISNANKTLADEIKNKNVALFDLQNKFEKAKEKNFKLLAEKEKLSQKLEAQNERIEIMQLSLDRYQSKSQEKNKDIYGNESKDNALHSQGVAGGIRGENKAEEILKMRLQIVDLRKRLSDEEKIRLNLFEIIKAKKVKNNVLKGEINKITSVFEENGKEHKWTQELIMQKDTIIKVLKEKISGLANENKALGKKIQKFLHKPLTEDKSVLADMPVNPELLVQVNASPYVFLKKGLK